MYRKIIFGISPLFLFVHALAAAELQPLPKPPPASEYKAPPGRSPEMQAFDKAVLYLEATQERDGHWDAAKSGGSPEFSGLNGDIAITALATEALVRTSQGKIQDPAALAHAKRALEWLLNHTQPDGRVADESAPGEPVISQMFAANLYLQTSSMSTRPRLRDAATTTINYALKNMTASCGGYGAAPKSSTARSDITGLATYLFASARMESITFDSKDVAPPSPAVPTKVKPDVELENNIKAGLKLLMSDSEKKSHKYVAVSGDTQADWDSTLSGAMAQTLLLVTLSSMKNGMNFIYGDLDEKTQTYPTLQAHLQWGKSGEGYKAMSLWQGTIAMAYNYSDNTPQLKNWITAARAILFDHQSPDGSWPVAGPDTARGKIFRTALHALTLVWLAPPPQPAPPPPQDLVLPPPEK